MIAPVVAKSDPKRRECVCPEEEAPLCELECPTRPQFYCGQLLSDAQLNSLVRWTQDRLALVRYRAGWGAVCGLAVRCDPHCHTRVVVEPGYAISCCGDDLVLCDTVCVDLKKACSEPCDPSGEPEPHDDDEVCEIAGEKVRPRLLRTVDITISRGETPVASEPVACGCGCNCEPAHDDEEEACAHTAIQEAACVGWRPAALGEDTESVALDRWEKAYKACARVVQGFRTQFPDLEQLALQEGRKQLGRRVREWLLAWLMRSPLHEFCFIEERIRRASPDDLLDLQWLATILFLIVQDCRNRHLLGECHACADGDVVRLARVWILLATDEFGRRTTRILFIDPRPPYRRQLGRACPPIARRRLNAAARALWRHPDDACIALTDAGIVVRDRQEVALPTRLDSLWTLLDCPPLLTCGQTVVLQVLDHCLFGPRVIGWSGQQPTQDDRRGREPPHGEDHSGRRHANLQTEQERAEAPGMPAPEAANESARSHDHDTRPQALREDDLTQIRDIGQRRARRCQERGINTFAMLARQSVGELRSLLAVSEGAAQAILDEARRQASGTGDTGGGRP